MKINLAPTLEGAERMVQLFQESVEKYKADIAMIEMLLDENLNNFPGIGREARQLVLEGLEILASQKEASVNELEVGIAGLQFTINEAQKLVSEC